MDQIYTYYKRVLSSLIHNSLSTKYLYSAENIGLNLVSMIIINESASSCAKYLFAYTWKQRQKQAEK